MGSSTSPGRMSDIAVVALGGTIAAPVDPTGSNSSLQLDADALVAALGLPDDTTRLHPETLRRLMSADIGWDDVLELARRITALAAAGMDGVVVTQGTDTLEETAYLLDLLLDVPVPVVLTGAMRNPGRPGADGAANLADSVRVALRRDAAESGVLVVMAGEIHSASAVRKTHTSSLGAFASPSTGPIGRVTEDRVVTWPTVQRSGPTRGLAVGADAPRVALHRLSLGDDAAVLDAIPELGYDGLVVEVYGAGHAGIRSLDALSRAADRMPVVFCSRTGSGDLYRKVGRYPGSEGDLIERGFVPADGLDGLKARLLLMYLIASGQTDPAILHCAFASA